MQPPPVVTDSCATTAPVRPERAKEDKTNDDADLKLEGPFPFTLTGVLSSFLVPLAENKIPIFAVSTFDTDYVLIKRETLEAAIDALQKAGHHQIR